MTTEEREIAKLQDNLEMLRKLFVFRRDKRKVRCTNIQPF